MMAKDEEPLPSQTLLDASTEDLAEALESIDTLVKKADSASQVLLLAMARVWVEGELRRRGGEA